MGGQNKQLSLLPTAFHSWHPFLFQVFLVYLRKGKGKLFNPFPLQLSGAVSVLQVQGLPCSDRAAAGRECAPRSLSPACAPLARPRTAGLCPSRPLPGLPQHSCSCRTQNALNRNPAFHCSYWLLRGNPQSSTKQESKSSHTCDTKKLQRLAPGHKVHLKGNCSTGDGTDYCLHMVWLVLLRMYKLFWKWRNLIFVLCTQPPTKGVSQS